jgi:hypothetical protein
MVISVAHSHTGIRAGWRRVVGWKNDEVTMRGSVACAHTRQFLVPAKHTACGDKGAHILLRRGVGRLIANAEDEAAAGPALHQATVTATLSAIISFYAQSVPGYHAGRCSMSQAVILSWFIHHRSGHAYKPSREQARSHATIRNIHNWRVTNTS